jgi:hypothetical protein
MTEKMTPRMLDLLAVHKEERSVPVRLSEEELDESRRIAIAKMSEQYVDDEEFSAIKKEYMLNKKDRAVVIKKAVRQHALGTDERRVMCFDVPDLETGMMNTYTQDCELVKSRRLMPDEKKNATAQSERTANIHKMVG